LGQKSLCTLYVSLLPVKSLDKVKRMRHRNVGVVRQNQTKLLKR